MKLSLDPMDMAAHSSYRDDTVIPNVERREAMRRALGGGNNRHIIIGIVSQALEMDKFKTILVERKEYGWLVWATDEKIEVREPALNGEEG